MRLGLECLVPTVAKYVFFGGLAGAWPFDEVAGRARLLGWGVIFF